MFEVSCCVVLVPALLVYAIQAQNIYGIIDVPMNNTVARIACQDIGMDLAVFHDEIDYCQAKQYAKRNRIKSFWIGLYNYDTNFVWADGSTGTWWRSRYVDIAESKNCYVYSAQKRKIDDRYCSDNIYPGLCGKEGNEKVMKNLPNYVPTLRPSDQTLYIFHVKFEDFYDLRVSSAYPDNPFGAKDGSIYIQKDTSILHDNYILEVTAQDICGAKETSFLCVAVFDTVIEESVTINPMCLSGQTGDELLEFLIPEDTLDKLCIALPLMDYNEPDKIIIAILHLQFTLDYKLFPYILQIMSMDNRDVRDFVYIHCEVYYPFPSTTPIVVTTEEEPGLQTTMQPSSICLEIENDTIKIPAEVSLGNNTLYLTRVDSLATACEIWSTPVQDDESTSPHSTETSIVLQSSQSSVDTTVSSDSGIMCMSWTSTRSELADDITEALKQQGDAGAQTVKEECGVFSCWSEGNQIGVIVVVVCIGVGLIAVTSLVVYKKVFRKSKVVPFPEPDRNIPPRGHTMDII